MPDSAIRLARSRGFNQEIVGEAAFQVALRRIAGPKSEHSKNTVVNAVLICQTDNPHDPNAVAVKIAGMMVGFLSREDAKLFRAELSTLDASLPDCFIDAKIVGGWLDEDSEGSYGVKLKLKRPLAVQK